MAMLALRPTPSSSTSTSPPKTTICTPHLLPLRINHNGPINSTQRHWAPEVDSKGTPFPYPKLDKSLPLTNFLGSIGTSHVHFRGRHLHGTSLPLPANYTGLVLRTTDKTLPHTSNSHPATPQCVDEDAEGERVEEEEVKIAEQIGSFEEVVMWGHGAEVGEGDEFVRGINEWVGFAEGVHVDEEEEEGEVMSS